MSDDLCILPSGADLNDDVYSCVLGQVDDGETLRNCRLVCKRWCAHVQWILEHTRIHVQCAEVIEQPEKKLQVITYTYTVVAGGVRHGPYHGIGDFPTLRYTTVYDERVRERGRYHFGEGRGYQVRPTGVDQKCVFPVHNHIHCATAFSVHTNYSGLIDTAIEVGYRQTRKYDVDGNMTVCTEYTVDSVGHLKRHGWYFWREGYRWWRACRYQNNGVAEWNLWRILDPDTLEMGAYGKACRVMMSRDYVIDHMVTKLACRAEYLHIDYWKPSSTNDPLPRRVSVYDRDPRPRSHETGFVRARIPTITFHCDENGELCADTTPEDAARWLALQPLPTLPRLPAPEDRPPPLPPTRVPPVLPKMLEVLRTIE